MFKNMPPPPPPSVTFSVTLTYVEITFDQYLQLKKFVIPWKSIEKMLKKTKNKKKKQKKLKYEQIGG